MPKNIWIPSSEMKVQVTEEGKVTVWQDMIMTLRPVNPPSGFKADDKPFFKPRQDA